MAPQYILRRLKIEGILMVLELIVSTPMLAIVL